MFFLCLLEWCPSLGLAFLDLLFSLLLQGDLEEAWEWTFASALSCCSGHIGSQMQSNGSGWCGKDHNTTSAVEEASITLTVADDIK